MFGVGVVGVAVETDAGAAAAVDVAAADSVAVDGAIGVGYYQTNDEIVAEIQFPISHLRLLLKLDHGYDRKRFLQFVGLDFGYVNSLQWKLRYQKMEWDVDLYRIPGRLFDHQHSLSKMTSYYRTVGSGLRRYWPLTQSKMTSNHICNPFLT